MKVGLQYPIPTPKIDTDFIVRRYDEIFDEVQWADKHGFHSMWITEHHFSNYSITSSPLLLLAKAAEMTKNLRLGTAILVLPIWDPIRLVSDISTLDVISGGRVDLGIGRGYQPHELRGFGQDPNTSRERFEECVELMLQLFTKEDSTFKGGHFSVPVPVTIVPRPIQRPHPPVWMATSSSASIRYAAKQGFNFMTPTTWTTPDLSVQREFMEQCIREVGPAGVVPEFEANRFIYCGTDPDELQIALRECGWQHTVSKELLQGNVPTRGINPEPAANASADAAMKDRLIAGTPDQIVAQFEALADVGVTYVLGQFRFGNLPRSIILKSMDRFAAEVLPRLSKIKSRPIVSGSLVEA